MDKLSVHTIAKPPVGTDRCPSYEHATMDPRSSLVTALQHCLPFLAAKNSEASIRWKVCLGRLSRCANEAFPGSECADEWRWIEEADEEALAAIEREEENWICGARIGLLVFAELQYEFADENK